MKNQKEMNTSPLTFIDKDEIEEMLCEYYDFDDVSEEQWAQIDKSIKAECERRGLVNESGLVEDVDLDEYYAICDGCVGKIIAD